MIGERSRYGLFVSALGAILLAVSVFLPWYGVSLTSAGTALVTHVGDQFAAQYGNASLQSLTPSFHGTIAALAGRQLGAVSAHEALKQINVILLILAGLALFDALVPLARNASEVPEGAGGAVVLLGVVAGLLVTYRMVSPPVPGGGIVTLSLREGAWLALLGALTMALGGLWPRVVVPSSPLEPAGSNDIWANLSGWTPGT
jgi:hypothetical protein